LLGVKARREAEGAFAEDYGLCFEFEDNLRPPDSTGNFKLARFGFPQRGNELRSIRMGGRFLMASSRHGLRKDFASTRHVRQSERIFQAGVAPAKDSHAERCCSSQEVPASRTWLRLGLMNHNKQMRGDHDYVWFVPAARFPRQCFTGNHKALTLRLRLLRIHPTFYHGLPEALDAPRRLQSRAEAFVKDGFPVTRMYTQWKYGRTYLYLVNGNRT
jgi:hypothetical protein